MPRKMVEKAIGGRRYRIRQLGSVTQDEVATRIILRASQNVLTTSDIMSAKDAMMDQTQVEIVDVESPNEVKPRTWVPLSGIYDDLLADDVGSRVEWLAAAVEVSFANFSGALARLVALRAALSSSSSPPTPDGSATGSS